MSDEKKDPQTTLDLLDKVVSDKLAAEKAKAAPPAPKPEPKAEPKPPEAEPDKDPTWLKGRLDAKAKAERKAYAEELAERFGMPIDKVGEVLKAHGEAEDAKKTELEKLLGERDALKPKAELASQYEDALREQAALQFEALGEAQRKVVEDLAGDDPLTRLRVINSLARTGLGGGAPSKMPAGADTSKAPPASDTPATPTEGTPEYHYQRWQAMPTLLKAAYFREHATTIVKADSYNSKG